MTAATVWTECPPRPVAIVTGALGGIGYATTRRLMEAGYHVVGMGTRPVGQADVDSAISGLGAHVTYLSGNIAVGEDRNRLVETALAVGEIRALVNVAGVAPRVRTDLLEMTEESYDRVMGINTKGTLFLTQSVARHMIANPVDEMTKTRGAIVNISSLSAYTSSVKRGEYCISKAGLSMITALYADRLAEYAIPVNEVRPGIIETDMTAAVKETYDTLIEGGLLPMARWGQPEDVAAAVLTLCTGALPYVTGQSIDVDGGFHIRRL